MFDNIDFQKVGTDILSGISQIAKSTGRFLTRQLLLLYYVLKDGDLSVKEKTMIYAAIVYVIVPNDLIPRRIFHVLGITDDVLAITYVVSKVKDKITPEIQLKVEEQLDRWFGYRISEV